MMSRGPSCVLPWRYAKDPAKVARHVTLVNKSSVSRSINWAYTAFDKFSCENNTLIANILVRREAELILELFKQFIFREFRHQ